MRLDLFLKVSRLVLRRTLAQEMCDAGAVRINGVQSKSGKEVKQGDEITIRQRGRIIKARILSVPTNKQVPKALASSLIEMISNEPDPTAII